MPTKKERLAALEIAQQLNQERIADLIVTVGRLTTGVETLTSTIQRTHGVVDIWADRITAVEAKLIELTTAFALHNNAVVDGQAILGREQARLAARLDTVERLLEPQVPRPFVWPYKVTVGDPQAATPFPTGAATTVDEVLAAVPPADDGPPRRGDRVRLEGALSTGSFPIANGWYDVVGHAGDVFQIAKRADDNNISWLGWTHDDDPGLKEIRRNAVQPKEVDDKDLDV